MNKNSLIAFASLLLIIIILIAIIIFRKPAVTIITGRENQVLDSLILLRSQVESSKIRESNLQRGYDSLSTIEPTIYTSTHEKTKFIFTDANPDQLDSIIRHTWKIKLKYSSQ